MPNTRAMWLGVGLGVGVLAMAGVLMAGPIDPPPGPVQSTFKTLAEVEPRVAINPVNTPGDADSLYRITQPGSYYLPGNVTGQSGKSGIEIASANVQIDLLGFTIQGVAGSLDGITATVAAAGVRVRNGLVTGFGGDGVDLGAVIQLGVTTIVESVVSTGNGGWGIVGSASTGIHACGASNNAAGGISALADSVIDGCTATANLVGISVGDGGVVVGCTAGENHATGIETHGPAMIRGCSVILNEGAGISTNSGCEIEGCNASENNLDGIKIASFCTVRGSVCRSNGFLGNGACIHATGRGNRIEGNDCLGADRGIDVDSAQNFIARNTCVGCTTNWDVVSGNICLVVAGKPGGAVLGDSGGVAPGSTDPNANFTY
ncbi:MAG: hypothetical protein IPJ41_00265 [Phycisphaerales bacterium]|nr:hypothetical protein [Phycisphaerales bacterium]